LIHALSVLSERDSYAPDLVVFLQCTSPFTTADDIDGTIEALINKNADTALAVTPFHYFLWKVSDGDALGINHDKAVRLMRQQREPEYVETGAVYVMRTSGFLASGHRFFGQTALHETPAERRIEIDEPEDFYLAEERLAYLQ